MDWFLYDRDLRNAELTKLDLQIYRITESEEKKENNFSRSRNFDFTCNIYGCLKWLEKPPWLINIKLYYRYVP